MKGATIGKLCGTWKLFDSSNRPVREATELEVELFRSMDELRQSAKTYEDLYAISERLMVRAKYNYEGLLIAHRRVVAALADAEAERDKLRAALGKDGEA